MGGALQTLRVEAAGSKENLRGFELLRARQSRRRNPLCGARRLRTGSQKISLTGSIWRSRLRFHFGIIVARRLRLHSLSLRSRFLFDALIFASADQPRQGPRHLEASLRYPGIYSTGFRYSDIWSSRIITSKWQEIPWSGVDCDASGESNCLGERGTRRASDGGTAYLDWISRLPRSRPRRH